MTPLRLALVSAALLVPLALLGGCESDGGGVGGGADTNADSAADIGGATDTGALPSDAGGVFDATGDVSPPPADGGNADVTFPPQDAVEDTPPPADVPPPPADVAPDAPAPPDAVVDVPAPPADVPGPPEDVAPPADVPVTDDLLTVACTVPYVLDESQATDMLYMTMHFGDLVQQWGIEGMVRGVDITDFPEKMYYGAHPPAEPRLSLVQVSMTDALTPQYSVRVDFYPDSAVTNGSVWGLGIDEGDAQAVVVRHETQTSLCVFALGTGGSLTVISATNVTATEGGAFRVTGTMQMSDPTLVPGACDLFAESGLPCCQ